MGPEPPMARGPGAKSVQPHPVQAYQQPGFTCGDRSSMASKPRRRRSLAVVGQKPPAPAAWVTQVYVGPPLKTPLQLPPDFPITVVPAGAASGSLFVAFNNQAINPSRAQDVRESGLDVGPEPDA